jgi:hypothetical protein
LCKIIHLEKGRAPLRKKELKNIKYDIQLAVALLIILLTKYEGNSAMGLKLRTRINGSIDEDDIILVSITKLFLISSYTLIYIYGHILKKSLSLLPLPSRNRRWKIQLL